MSKKPYFQFYSQDFLVGVMDLTMQERGQYITLLCFQHQKGRLSIKQIRILVPDHTPDVLAKFERDKKGLYFNKRLEESMADYDAYIAKQRANGLKGGRPRKNPKETQEKPKVKANGKPSNEVEDINSSFHNTHAHARSVSELEGEEREKLEEEIKKTFDKFVEDWRKGEFASIEVLCLQAAKIAPTKKKQLGKYFPKFKLHLISERNNHKTTHQMAKHFLNWLRRVKTSEQYEKN